MGDLNYQNKFNIDGKGKLALSVLVVWIGFIITGIFIFVSSFIYIETSFISLFFNFPITGIACLVMFYSSRNISHALIDLSKNKKWTDPNKFIQNILLQVATAIIASIITQIIFGANYFTTSLILDFILLFNYYILMISFGFFSISLYIYTVNLFWEPRKNVAITY